MFYVEWLRVRNCLRVLAIVFGIIFLLGVIARIAFGLENEQIGAQIQHEMHAPGARVSRTRLPDGSTRTTIYDPGDGDRIVVIDRGWNGKHITISGPDIETESNAHVQVGSLGVHARPTTHGGVVTVDTDEALPLRVLFPFAAFVALIIGTVLCGPLAKENDGHLDVVWTKPASRERLAIGYFLVDAVGMLASMAMTMLLIVILTALFEFPRFVADAQTLPTLALSILLPFAWYGLLTMCSASIKKGGRGAVIGLAWVLAWILPPIALGLRYAQEPFFHAIGVGLSYLMLLDPIVYMHLSANFGPGGVTQGAVGDMFGPLSAPALTRAAVLLFLTIVYSVISLIQWRRLEA
ncbi:MAG: hypothetical protein ACREMP_04950 [Candidatus Tyrphobacter sp.]